MARNRRFPVDVIGAKEVIVFHALSKWRVVLVACLGLLAVGLVAWKNIPRLEDARIESPGASVLMTFPGASPEDVEARVIRVLEPALNGLDGLKSIESTARPNVGMLILKFQDGTPMDTMTEQIRGKILSKRVDLPSEVKDPEVTKFSTAFTAQMVLAVTGYRSLDVLSDTARRFRDELLALPGVSTVELRGERSPAIRVRLDPDRLAKHNLSADGIVARLRQNSVTVPAGELRVGSLSTFLQLEHEQKDVRSIAQMPVAVGRDANGNSRTVLLSDIAEISSSYLPIAERFMYEGAPAVGIEVRFRSNANAVSLGESVRKLARDYAPRLKQAVQIRIAYDQPEWVDKHLSDFAESLLEGILLVMIVVTLGLGLRSSLAVAIALPLAIGGALVGLLAGGFALEQVSIAGLIVSLGLLVDDAVLVMESIQLVRERGISPFRGAVLGTARVFWANNVTTAVACASFLPFFFMGGDVGKFIKGLPTAVVLALVTSLLVAQVVTPLFSTRLLRKPKNVPPISDDVPFEKSWDQGHDVNEERNLVFRGLKWLYNRTVPLIVNWPWVVVGLAVIALAASLSLFPRIGFQFFPKSDKPLLFVRVDLPRGTEEGITGEVAAGVVQRIRALPFVKETSAIIGGGYPPIFLGRASAWSSTDVADIMVRIHPDTPTDNAAHAIERAVAGIVGPRIRVDELYTGPPVAHPVMIRILGDDFERLRAYAEDAKRLLRSVPGAVNVQDNLSETVPLTSVELDADRALRFGVTPAQVGITLRLLYGSDKVYEFTEETETRRVILERLTPAESALPTLESTRIPTALGTTVPLFAIAKIKVKRGYAELHRRDGRRVVEVTSDASGTTLPSQIVIDARRKLDQIKWEPGYSYVFAGQQEETENSFTQLALAGIGALVVIGVLLLLLFDSFRLVLAVIAAVPFVLIGILPGLAFTNNPFGFMAFLGTVALLGVFVNHKIYFVDRSIELMRRGLSIKDAIRQAGVDRIRPVVLTALTAVLGLLPLTLKGGPLWSAFGWVNVYGLVISIPLSLVLLPALMVIFYKNRISEGDVSLRIPSDK
jgi:multidrug efflux pump subunit AcrB